MTSIPTWKPLISSQIEADWDVGWAQEDSRIRASPPWAVRLLASSDARSPGFVPAAALHSWSRLGAAGDLLRPLGYELTSRRLP
jgi:hypothetical protein